MVKNKLLLETIDLEKRGGDKDQLAGLYSLVLPSAMYTICKGS